MSYFLRMFDPRLRIFKAGTSEGARKAWEARHAAGEKRQEEKGGTAAGLDRVAASYTGAETGAAMHVISGRMDSAKAMTAMPAEYNEFSRDRIGKILSRFPGVQVQVGREYSPVIYAHGTLKDLMVLATDKNLRADERGIYVRNDKGKLSFHRLDDDGKMTVSTVDEKARAKAGLSNEGHPKEKNSAVARLWWD